jgi:hypothetical protein
MASNKTVGFATGLANAAMFYYMNEDREKRQAVRDARDAARDKKMGIEPPTAKPETQSLWDKGVTKVKKAFSGEPASASAAPETQTTPAIPAAPAAVEGAPMVEPVIETTDLPAIDTPAIDAPELLSAVDPTPQEWVDLPPMGSDDMNKMAAIPASTFSAASA